MTGQLTDVVVNGVRLRDEEVAELERLAGVKRAPLRDGTYWYDPVSGAWGAHSGPTLGFRRAGLAVGGPLRPGASNGHTGVFVNGRELHRLDVLALERLGQAWLGRYWLDALGNFGREGGSMLGNLVRPGEPRASEGTRGGAWATCGGGAALAAA
ncbi:MAG: hypothetical protein ACREVS_17945 [Burkholderiales bacterium]